MFVGYNALSIRAFTLLQRRDGACDSRVAYNLIQGYVRMEAYAIWNNKGGTGKSTEAFA